MAEVGTAFVSILPSAKGFGTKLQKQVDGSTKGVGKSLGKAFAVAGGATAIVGGLAKSISLAKDFDLTIRQVGVASGESGAGLKTLSALAMKMGADTAFSAKDAGDAMLELAKGGMTAAQIKGGALATTLKLAAAGGLELGAASTFVVQGMTTFGLKASEANRVAVALGGGANASTASVESLGQALSQVGPGAKNAGLSLEETVATLAAFDNAGIKGSDAGTSLKTMLTRLVPSTDKASTAMDTFGLSFVDSKGNIDDISTVAQKLQKHLGGLSQAERTTALSTIFGSDATRAASVLMDNGAKGINKYIKATKDQSQVQKMANAAMGGASGSWDSFTGSIETLQIKLGTALLPAFTKATDALTKFANKVGTFVDQMQSGKGAGGKFADTASRIANVLERGKTVIGAVAGAYLGYKASLLILAGMQKVAAAATATHTFAMEVQAGAVALNQSLLFTWIGVKALEFSAWVRSTAGAVASTIAMGANRAAYAALSLQAFIVQKGIEFAAWVRTTAATVASTAATLASAAASKIAAGAARVWAAGQWLLNAAMTANPIGIVVVAIAALVAGFIIAYKKSETFRTIVNGAFKAVVAVGKFMWKALVTYFQIVANVWLTVAGVIIHGAAKAFGWIPGIGGKIKGLAKGFDRFKDDVNGAINKIKGQKDVKVQVTGGAAAALAGIQNQVNALDGARAAVTVGVTGAGAGRIRANARGTNDFAGGLTWVGERGPEIVNLPRHSQVIPNHKLGHAANGIGDGVVRVIVVNPGDIAMATDGRADMRVAAHAGVSREAARARR